MENDVKQRNQRNRRRERAQRMQAQRENKAKDGDSAEDESPAREKPQRPPNRRKKSKEPQFEEDIIDGFAILAFRTYEELENAMKHAGKNNMKMFSAVTLGDEKPPKLLDTGQRTVTTPINNNNTTTTNHNNNTTTNHNHQPPPPHPPTPTTPAQAGVTLNHDAGTSDDSGRASERLNGACAPLERDSSHDRLSDASSRCSSGKGYIVSIHTPVLTSQLMFSVYIINE
ncbi:fibrosin-1-like protein [Schistocerca cancellata]|uniref:fibrosin-1-like protein n=1 Tax=Schistocerca cancellata TaxID=274614 RepID=UPI0021177157|nr:fibrosin-1-like protein [Schistocerca cancellata]